ncbi:PREDICTED: protein unc-93 homolog B1 [Condylura cristata]|uniref:protein unc-93 homolog B1 n=1 Tax=Condylura cristata TaxID=143302 RepID=UPI00033442DD|nr:PREDICTED: protein unc-93 homolog B1 [Condylura cristata]
MPGGCPGGGGGSARADLHAPLRFFGAEAFAVGKACFGPPLGVPTSGSPDGKRRAGESGKEFQVPAALRQGAGQGEAGGDRGLGRCSGSGTEKLHWPGPRTCPGPGDTERARTDVGLLQMQLILHYDETYREVKYGSMGLPDIDSKMLMGINVTPIAALLYTPVLIRFFGTKWMMFLAVGIYALFVSTNYWERYYTLVPSAVALGMAIVPLWASMGNYITRMSQKYYEYSHYKERDEQGPRQRPPRGSHAPYLLVFQAIFYSFFHLSFACAQLPMVYFLNHYLYDLNHTLYNVQSCGTNSQGILNGFNKTVLRTLPRSRSLIVVESVLMAMAFLAMLVVLGLCGAAYRPTEEIDLRSVGWGNIFQLPFKHVRDFRLRHLVPFFIYSGFEVLFACTGIALGYGVCSVGLERLAYLLVAYGLGASASSLLGLLGLWLPRPVPLVAGAGLHLLLILGLFFWAPVPRVQQHAWILYGAAVLWGVGSALNKTGLSTLLGILYEDKERQDFIFTIYHWWQAVAIFIVYLGSGLPMKAKLAVLLLTLLAGCGSYLWMEQKLRLGYGSRAEPQWRPWTAASAAITPRLCQRPSALPTPSFHSGAAAGSSPRGAFGSSWPSLTHDGPSAFDSDFSEILLCQNEITLALRNLHNWMKDEPVANNLITKASSTFIRKEPFGLVLIIAPWNYPVNLTLVPLAWSWAWRRGVLRADLCSRMRALVGTAQPGTETCSLSGPVRPSSSCSAPCVCALKPRLEDKKKKGKRPQDRGQ